MKILKPAALILGLLLLFGVAFMGFAWMRADNPHQLPLVGGLFPEPPEPEPEPETEVSHAATGTEVLPRPSEAGLGLFDVFRVESPLDKTQLASLASDLKLRLAALDEREDELARAEVRLSERAQFLDEQLATVNNLRTELERWQTELEQRQVALRRDEGVQAERDAVSWAKMAKLFEKGEAPALAVKLGGYSPEDAARILSCLKPDRARELLEGLGGESWKDYWDAYRRALGETEP